MMNSMDPVGVLLMAVIVLTPCVLLVRAVVRQINKKKARGVKRLVYGITLRGHPKDLQEPTEESRSSKEKKRELLIHNLSVLSESTQKKFAALEQAVGFSGVQVVKEDLLMYTKYIVCSPQKAAQIRQYIEENDLGGMWEEWSEEF